MAASNAFVASALPATTAVLGAIGGIVASRQQLAVTVLTVLSIILALLVGYGKRVSP